MAIWVPTRPPPAMTTWPVNPLSGKFIDSSGSFWNQRFLRA